MKILHLTAAGLSNFISTETFKKLEFLPITTHRAIAHINNPQVDKEDVLMILAMSDTDELLGYLGVIPDRFYFGDSSNKIGWMSCIWINNKIRVKGLAKILLEEALKDWNNNIVATGFTKTAKKLYDRSGAFIDFGYKTGVRGYFRFNISELLPIIKPAYKKFSPLLQIADSALNLANDLRLRLTLKSGDWRMQYIDKIDSETATFIQPFLQNQLSRRDADDLNWILQHPWILPEEKRNSEGERYFFSSFDKSFTFSAIKVFNSNDSQVAFVILAARNKMLKVPYLYCQDLHLDKVVAAIYKHMFHHQLYTITVHNEQLTKILNEKKTPFVHKKNHEKGYIISKNFENLLTMYPNLIIQDGDGDGAFT